MQASCEKIVCATVGIDVSKDSLEAVLRREEREQPRICAKSAAGFLELHRWLHALCVEPAQTRVA